MRSPLAVALAIAGMLGVLVTGTAAQASDTSCPAAGTYVPGTTWHRTVLGNGISLSEARKRDSRGVVDMHVLRVTTTTPGVHFGPLTSRLAERHPLSSLAAGRAHLLAASNTGYYDFTLGAPTGPVIVAGRPWGLSSGHQAAFGFTSGNIAQAGHVWLTGTATWGSSRVAVVGINRPSVPAGLSVYTPLWGTAHRVVLPSGSVSRYVVSGKVTTATGTYTSAPSSGFLVVARGSTAVAWLKAPPKGAAMSIVTGVATDAPQPFAQAYGVGVTLVSKQSTATTGFSCRSSYPQPARTAVGYTNGGKTLVIAIVTDHPGTEVHGLDADQMSKLMAELGVTRAFSFDGSGSTELLARMPGTSSLAIRNYTADGHERTMPLGLGVYLG